MSCQLPLFSFLVDTTPPVIFNCPGSTIILHVAIGVPGGQVFWVEPSASDVSGTVTVAQTSSPSDFFPVGDTIVEYSFSDISGNIAICTFIVSVRSEGKLTKPYYANFKVLSLPKMLCVLAFCIRLRKVF